MRLFALILLCGGTVFAQSMTEFGAAAAAGTVGGANGKRVSDGVSAIFGKVAGTMEKPAAEKSAEKAVAKVEKASPEPLIKGGLGVAKAGADPSGVPAPPPLKGAVRETPVMTQARVDIPAEIGSYSEPLPVLPPPPTMSREGLQQVNPGMSRVELLHHGEPASKITMYENGHLVEVYSYRENGRKFGTVRLEDGAVANVTIQ
jgi:hypothetical protein